MAYNWDQYLDLSGHLLENKISGIEDACFRSSISRAYYSALHKARLFIEANGIIVPEDFSMHHYIIGLYRNSESEVARSIGLYLDRLRSARNESDYNDNAIMKETKAKRYFEDARWIIANVDSVSPSSIVPFE
jgi:uncharacterized protein (UPF0332 family)